MRINLDRKSKILRYNKRIINPIIKNNLGKKNSEIAEEINNIEKIREELSGREITDFDIKYYLENTFFEEYPDLKETHKNKKIKSKYVYNWMDKFDFIINMIETHLDWDAKQYTDELNRNFPKELHKAKVEGMKDFLTRVVYKKREDLLKKREEAVKVRRGSYNFKGKEDRLLEIFKKNIDRKWRELAKIVNKEFPDEFIKITGRKLQDYFVIKVFPDYPKLREDHVRLTSLRHGYIWTEEKIKYLKELLRIEPKLSRDEIIKKMNQEFKEVKGLTRRSLANGLGPHVYREVKKEKGRIICVFNRKPLKRNIEWEGEIKQRVAELLEISPKIKKQKINNLDELLKELKEEFPEFEYNLTYSKIYNYIVRKFPEHLDRLKIQFELRKEYVDFWFSKVVENQKITVNEILDLTKQKFSSPYCQKLPSKDAMERYLRIIKRNVSIPENIEEKRKILEDLTKNKLKSRKAKKEAFDICVV
ncbi:MAG: hypothetical protein WC356_03250 [Candidatus Micrarchaeia archaeon]|jgi:hypothetical protein